MLVSSLAQTRLDAWTLREVETTSQMSDRRNNLTAIREISKRCLNYDFLQKSKAAK